MSGNSQVLGPPTAFALRGGVKLASPAAAPPDAHEIARNNGPSSFLLTGLQVVVALVRSLCPYTARSRGRRPNAVAQGFLAPPEVEADEDLRSPALL